MTASIADVAALAGVSVTTVSHALSGNRPVAPETRERITMAVAELGYRPNRLAQSLRSQQTLTTALIIPDITNPFFPEVARAAQDLLSADGYQLFICNTDGDAGLERKFLADAVDRRVDGVIVVPFATAGVELDRLRHAQIPTVLLSAMEGAGRRGKGVPHTDAVHTDDQRGTAMATQFLLDSGHRRIGFINGAVGTGPAERRLAGWREALQNSGEPVRSELAVSTSFTRVGGAEGLTRLLRLAQPPTAVVCANDLIAIGALDVARARGLVVPDDLAVIGFDDIDAASLVAPPLTTISNPAREIGHTCARLLLDRMSGQYVGAPREVVVAHTLVRRSST